MQNPIRAHGFLALPHTCPFELIEAWWVVSHVPLWDELWDECFHGWHVIGGLATEVGQQSARQVRSGLLLCGLQWSAGLDFGQAEEYPNFAKGTMTHGIEAFVGYVAQLLCDALLDHLEVSVPLACVSFETGPPGALHLSNDGLRHRLQDRISA